MSDPIDPRYLEIFPTWLRTLGQDAKELGDELGKNAAGGDEVNRYVIAGLNYIFKSLDLIPDGIDDLGFLDDAFVLRVACDLAVGANSAARVGHVARLAQEAAAVREFLGGDYVRLEAYVKGLKKGAARGRTVEDILTDDATRVVFLQEVTAWGNGYHVPSFTRDMKTLVKLKAFLSAKLA